MSRTRGVNLAAPLIAILVLALSACSATAGPTPAPSLSPSPVPTATQTVTPPPSAPPSVALPTESVPTTPSLAIDPALLSVLPASVDGVDVVESPEGEAAAADAPEFAAVASAVAAAIAVDTATGEFVFAVVVQLKPGAMTDARFSEWRVSFDEGACSQADGVAGQGETELNGRSVYIGACNGGLDTYHVWLAEQDILISASAAGDRRLGELLMSDLRVH